MYFVINAVQFVYMAFVIYVIIFLTYQFIHILGSKKNRLNETVLLSTKNMFWLKYKKFSIGTKDCITRP